MHRAQCRPRDARDVRFPRAVARRLAGRDRSGRRQGDWRWRVRNSVRLPVQIPHRPGVFQTQHSGDGFILMQRNIQHRRDIVGLQIGFRKFPCERVGMRGGSGNQPFSFDGAKVIGKLLRGRLTPEEWRLRGLFIQVQARYAGSIFGKLPDTGARHADECANRFPECREDDLQMELFGLAVPSTP